MRRTLFSERSLSQKLGTTMAASVAIDSYRATALQITMNTDIAPVDVFFFTFPTGDFTPHT
jgi:hypothetical protein